MTVEWRGNAKKLLFLLESWEDLQVGGALGGPTATAAAGSHISLWHSFIIIIVFVVDVVVVVVVHEQRRITSTWTVTHLLGPWNLDPAVCCLHSRSSSCNGPSNLPSTPYTQNHRTGPQTMFLLQQVTAELPPLVAATEETRSGGDAFREATLTMLFWCRDWSPNCSKNISPDWRRLMFLFLAVLHQTLITASLVWLLLTQINAGKGFEPSSWHLSKLPRLSMESHSGASIFIGCR